MTLLIKAKLKKSGDQTKIDKYRVARKYYIKINLNKTNVKNHIKINTFKMDVQTKRVTILELLQFLHST